MPATTSDRDNGIVIGIVYDLDDPEKLGRVRVTLPHLAGQISDWAYLVTPMAGKNRGLFMRPEKDDQVLVAFTQGDPRFPYILGSLWSKADPPPPDDGDAVKNNWRFIKSRSGHIVKLDDTLGKEQIEIVDKDGNRSVLLDSANKKIQVHGGSDNATIEILADAGDINITANTGNVTVSANSGQINLTGATIEVNATSTLTLTAGGTLTIQGLLVQIN